MFKMKEQYNGIKNSININDNISAFLIIRISDKLIKNTDIKALLPNLIHKYTLVIHAKEKNIFFSLRSTVLLYIEYMKYTKKGNNELTKYKNTEKIMYNLHIYLKLYIFPV